MNERRRRASHRLDGARGQRAAWTSAGLPSGRSAPELIFALWLALGHIWLGRSSGRINYWAT